MRKQPMCSRFLWRQRQQLHVLMCVWLRRRHLRKWAHYLLIFSSTDLNSSVCICSLCIDDLFSQLTLTNAPATLVYTARVPMTSTDTRARVTLATTAINVNVSQLLKTRFNKTIYIYFHHWHIKIVLFFWQQTSTNVEVTHVYMELVPMTSTNLHVSVMLGMTELFAIVSISMAFYQSITFSRAEPIEQKRHGHQSGHCMTSSWRHRGIVYPFCRQHQWMQQWTMSQRRYVLRWRQWLHLRMRGGLHRVTLRT